MRILFLSHYFPPEVNAPANRTHEHARLWAAQGHDVTVITGVPNHPAGVLFPGYRNRLIQEEQVDGIRVIRTWMYLTANAGFARRILNYVLFAAMAIAASFRAERPDVVVATSPQFFCGLAGMVVSRLKRRPFVLEVRDLWPDSIVQLGQLESRPLIRLLEAVETLLYRSAAAVVVNTRAFIDHIAARGVPRDRIELIYNGIEPDVFQPQPRDEALLARHGLAGRFVAAYTGTLGLAHGLTTIVEAADQLRDDPEVVFVLIGDGAERGRLEAEIAARRLSNVKLVGLQPRSEMPAWIASTDLALVLLRDLPVFKTVIPSKVFEILAQERPMLLAAPPGEIRQLVTEAKAGFVVSPESADALVDTIRRVRAHPDEAAAQARNGRDWVLTHFDRTALADRMLSFLKAAGGAR